MRFAAAAASAVLLAILGIGEKAVAEEALRSFSWPNGDTFVGEFRDGLPNGKGVMQYADGRIYSGTWVNGCLRTPLRRIAVFTTLEACRTKNTPASNKGTPSGGSHGPLQ